jgi:hypothetical protein
MQARNFYRLGTGRINQLTKHLKSRDNGVGNMTGFLNLIFEDCLTILTMSC